MSWYLFFFLKNLKGEKQNSISLFCHEIYFKKISNIWRTNLFTQEEFSDYKVQRI